MNKLIIGLGNPSGNYKNTRHNIGFIAIDKFRDLNETFFSNWKNDSKTQSEISTAHIDSNKIILSKPQTFMNKSGIAAQKLISYYKIDLENVLVIHDDIDLELGEYKLQRKKSSAGHKGVQDIIEKINSNDFWRLRIGVAKPEKKKMGDASSFVLRKFSIWDKSKIKKILEQIILEIENFIKQ